MIFPIEAIPLSLQFPQVFYFQAPFGIFTASSKELSHSLRVSLLRMAVGVFQAKMPNPQQAACLITQLFSDAYLRRTLAKLGHSVGSSSYPRNSTISSIRKIPNLSIFSVWFSTKTLGRMLQIRKLAKPRAIFLWVLKRAPMSSEMATCTSSYCLISSPIISFSYSSKSSVKLSLFRIFFSSESLSSLSIFSEKSLISCSLRKQSPSSQSMLFKVSSSTITICESYSLSMVSTRVPMNSLARLTASTQLEVLTAMMRLGKHLQAYSLTSSLGCSLMMLHKRLTVFSTQGLQSSFSCSMKTLSMEMATSASSVSWVLIFWRSSSLASSFASSFIKSIYSLITFSTNKKRPGKMLSRQAPSSFPQTRQRRCHPARMYDF